MREREQNKEERKEERKGKEREMETETHGLTIQHSVEMNQSTDSITPVFTCVCVLSCENYTYFKAKSSLKGEISL